MSTFREQADLARSDDFRVRVQQAAITAAINISSEGTSNKRQVDDQRLSLARQVLADPDSWAKKFAFGIAAIIAEDTDAAISGALGGIWNAYAGVNPNLVALNPDDSLAAGIVSGEEIVAAQAEAPSEVKSTPWYTKWFGIGG